MCGGLGFFFLVIFIAPSTYIGISVGIPSIPIPRSIIRVNVVGGGGGRDNRGYGDCNCSDVGATTMVT